MKLDVLNIQGGTTGRSIELPDSIFGIQPNEHVLYLAVKSYLANQRQGTHKAKERGEVAGSTRKLHKQKGTGGSRKGDIKNPLYHGGGRVFGPRPRNYRIDLPKKVRMLARKSALAAKAQAGAIMVVEDFTFDAPKTKAMHSIITGLNIPRRALLVTGEYDKMVYLSGRNLPSTEIATAADFNTYAVLKSGTVVLCESAVKKITETFA